MKYNIDPKEVRIYSVDDSCIFKKNKDQFGGLSNMASIYPITVNGIKIKTSEALYQACRFPHFPDIQKRVIEEKSPMTVKMISNANKKKSREDWEIIRIKAMKWCISVKLSQNFITFGTLLCQTGMKNIVENSAKDNFWGAIPNDLATVFTGKNALGRLLMDLRKTFYSEDRYSLLYVDPPQIDNFLLYGEPIRAVDERSSFINWLQNYWELNLTWQTDNSTNNENKDAIKNSGLIGVEEDNQNTKEGLVKTNRKGKTGHSDIAATNLPNLFSGL